jgi:UDP-N-acetylmuramate--alanine ligase
MEFLRPGTSVHFVGIGGIGLSAIARVLHGWHFQVSGSDQASSCITEALAAEGIEVFVGHRRENITRLSSRGDGAEVLVVISSAIPAGNPEVMEAKQCGIPVVKRREILGELTAGKTTIAVAGTHGKTTTTAMIAWILVEAGLNPSFVVGGTLQNLDTNAAAGTGPYFVIEADEYDRAFLGLSPDVAVLLSAEHDHPDCYPTWSDMRAAFADFTDRVVGGGRLIVCGDDGEVRRLGERAAGRERGHGIEPVHVVTYGLGSDWDWRAVCVQLQGCPSFTIQHRGRPVGNCALQLPGLHSVQNALAALAVAAEVGVDIGVAAAALTRFRGTARRFEVKGHAAGVTVVDDYAHHPTEIRATLRAARIRYPDQPIWAVFQPHTFSRTAVLLEGFASAFDEADHVIVTSIYAAREEDTYGVSAMDLVARIRSHSRAQVVSGTRPDVQYASSLESAVVDLLDRVRPGDVVLTLGAGDGYLIGERLLARMAEAAEPRTRPNGESLVKPAGQHNGDCHLDVSMPQKRVYGDAQ